MCSRYARSAVVNAGSNGFCWRYATASVSGRSVRRFVHALACARQPFQSR